MIKIGDLTAITVFQFVAHSYIVWFSQFSSTELHCVNCDRIIFVLFVFSKLASQCNSSGMIS